MSMSAAANGSDLSHVDRAGNMARGLRSRMDIDMQLGILRDSQLALELSETSVRNSRLKYVRLWRIELRLATVKGIIRH